MFLKLFNIHLGHLFRKKKYLSSLHWLIWHIEKTKRKEVLLKSICYVTISFSKRVIIWSSTASSWLLSNWWDHYQPYSLLIIFIITSWMKCIIQYTLYKCMYNFKNSVSKLRFTSSPRILVHQTFIWKHL